MDKRANYGWVTMGVLVRCRHGLEEMIGSEKPISTNRNELQIRYASYSANEWLDPMKEAPSFEGAFLFQRHPPSGSLGGGVLVTVGVRLARSKRAASR